MQDKIDLLKLKKLAQEKKDLGEQITLDAASLLLVIERMQAAESAMTEIYKDYLRIEKENKEFKKKKSIIDLPFSRPEDGF